MAPPRAPLALTMGEPGGIGGEITVAAWNALRAEGPAFFPIADPQRLAHLGAPTKTIEHPSEAPAVFADALPVLPIGAPVISIPGRADPRYADLVLESIRRAVAFALEGAASGVVTNPIQKSSLIDAGFEFPGHTEFLDELTKDAPTPAGLHRGCVMMIAGPLVRTVPATVHLPLKDAITALDTDMLIETGRVVASSLAVNFGVNAPRLAFAGLNPHAGEDGKLGREDRDIIAPAVHALEKAGIDAAGPLPADGMFHEEARAAFDAAICMYHDQALIPAKALNFHEAVNVTLGLPIVRTSPDHGTALAIAGKGRARADSLIAALRLAAAMADRRAANVSAA